MSAPLLHKYEVALKALLRMHPELDGVVSIATDAADWVQEFLSSLDTVFEAGAFASVDVPVVGFLQDICSQLLHLTDEDWIKHSPCVVEGQEQLHQLAAMHAMPAPAVPTTNSTIPVQLSPLPLDEFLWLVEYTKAGYCACGLTIPFCHSTTFFFCAVAVAVSSAISGTESSSSMRQSGVKHAHSEELMDISLLLDYVWCDFCTCNKVKCTPWVGCAGPTLALVLPSTGPAGLLKTNSGVLPGTDKAAMMLFWWTKLVWACTTAEVALAHVSFIEQRYAEVLGNVIMPEPLVLEPWLKCAKVEKGKKRSVNVLDDDEVVEVDGPTTVWSLILQWAMCHLQIAERTLLLYGQTMVKCPLWVKNVTEWLWRFYPLWASIHTAASLSCSAISCEAYKLFSEVKEWAVPYAIVEWLQLFPKVVEGVHDWLVLHSAIISNAQACVLNIWLLVVATSGNLPDVCLEASWEQLLACGSAVTQSGTLLRAEETVVLDQVSLPPSSSGSGELSGNW
ncbi:hypothetical protein H4582DRAFT_2064078 [Lactarius indigo]|nr:hypothetical protein H4582DRAFT_2064078 [Lactarius indigo]